MLLGKHKHTLDDKNRLIIPAKLRKYLGEELVLQPGYDSNVLILRSKKSFMAFYEDMNNLSNNQFNFRNYRRFLLSNTLELNADKQGRVTIPAEELNKANLSKDIIIVGMGEYLEIWDSKTFEKSMNEIAPIVSELVESIEKEKKSFK